MPDTIMVTTIKNIQICGFLPLLFKQKLVGILEIYSEEQILYFENVLAKISAALPLLSQLLKNSTDIFSESINDVVRHNFTVL